VLIKDAEPRHQSVTEQGHGTHADHGPAELRSPLQDVGQMQARGSEVQQRGNNG